MRRFLLDTNILVHYARQSALYSVIESSERLSESDAVPMISVVTAAEILSFGVQHNWGKQKIQAVEQLISKIVTIDINLGDKDLLETYAKIDAYSKNKLPGTILGKSITMGKNDLWIAATAVVSNATLLTTDGDFDHLHGSFLVVKKYP